MSDSQVQAFPVLPTRVDLGSDGYKTNRDAQLEKLEVIDQALVKSRAGGGEKYNTRHKDRGKLLPRERIELLLDRDSHFLEICPLAGHDMGGVTTGGSVVGGIGLISGVECLISASESTVKGGAINEIGLKKSLRLGEISLENTKLKISDKWV